MSDIDVLTSCGEALYGARWKTDLARDLGYEVRRMHQWINGERPIPAGVWAVLAGQLQQRRKEINQVLLGKLADQLRTAKLRGSDLASRLW